MKRSPACFSHRVAPACRGVLLEALEPRTYLAATTLGVLTDSFIFNDADGDQVTVRLRGPGTCDVTLTNDAADLADLQSIALHDTTGGSALSVSVRRARIGPSDGATTIGTITGGSIGSLDIRRATLTGAGVNLTGTLRSIRAAGFANGADLLIGQAGTLQLDLQSLASAQGNPVTIATPGSVTRLRLRGDVSGLVLNVGGGVTNARFDGSADNVTFNVGQRLGQLRVAGDLTGNSLLAAAGGIGSLTIGGGMSDSLVLAGASLDADLTLAHATFGVASIQRVTIKRDMVDSIIAAGGDPGADRLFSRDEVLAGGQIKRLKVGGVIAGIDSPHPNPGIYASSLGKVAFASRLGRAVIDPLPSSEAALTTDDINQILSQAIARAEQLGRNAFIAILDREGNILAAVRMTEAGLTAAADNVDITAGGSGGLEVIDGQAGDPATVSSALAAVSKAGTAAFLSTSGNAFSTRTAGYIIQEHFAPGVANQPAGPLFGVQFSSLPTSDINRLPLGLSADPGGLPIYRDGQVLGGIGVEFDGTYTIDPTRVGGAPTPEEQVALAGLAGGFAAPANIRADRVFVGGLRLDYANAPTPALASLGPLPAIADLQTSGKLALLIDPHTSPVGKFKLTTLSVGGQTIIGEVPNQADDPNLPTVDFYNDGTGQTQFLDGASSGGEQLTAADVETILGQAHALNSRLRAAIRRDSPQVSQVSVSVVDADGNLLGTFRSADAPVFGYDVSVQKARSAAFLSRSDAGAALTALGSDALGDAFGQAVTRAGAAGLPLDGSVALSERAIGFLSVPHLPDGIDHAPRSPWTTPLASAFSIFNTGLQTELFLNKVVGFLQAYEAQRSGVSEASALQQFADGTLGGGGIVGGGTVAGSGVALPGKSLFNGLQIFAGGVPLYKDGKLVGAIGVSGDGTEQDDLVAYAGAAGFRQYGQVKRADEVLVSGGVRLPYVKLPRSPFAGA